VERLREQGAEVKVLAVKNCGLVREASAYRHKAPKVKAPVRRRGHTTKRGKKRWEKIPVGPDVSVNTAGAVALSDGSEATASVAVSGADGEEGDDAEEDIGDAVWVNRVELNTDYDFDKVRGCAWVCHMLRPTCCVVQVSQLLYSPPAPCPLKEGYSYTNVVAFDVRSPVPQLFPYLYDTTVEGHSLSHWLFVNNKLKESAHFVEFESG
jgi:hypothetical protein